VTVHAELAALGVATVYEASGRKGLIDCDLFQILPDSSVAGPVRTVLCGQDDNLTLHAAIAAAVPGDILVVTMPEPRPIGIFGGLLAVQAQAQGIAGLLINAAVRDVADLRRVGLPVWSRWIRVAGSSKTTFGALDGPVTIGGATVRVGDTLVLDGDGAVVVHREDLSQVLVDSRARKASEDARTEQYRNGALSYDLLGLRAKVESADGPREA
jgi:4-hydroxy-4-methyl-2-oxoglutarate aldolase